MNTSAKSGRSPQRARVVIDTNVFVSAIVFGGKPKSVVDAVLESSTLVASAEILSEIKRIIYTKFPDFTESFSYFEKLLKRDAILVELGGINIHVSRDPDDDRILEAAVIGGANYIISGDKDLLELGSYQSINIIRPADYLQL